MNQSDRIAFIAEHIKAAAALEQLAEEAAELTHAALKYARIVRGENPTPVNLTDAHDALTEEMGDVILCARVLMAQGVAFDNNAIAERKARRWVDRIREEEARKNGADDVQIQHAGSADAPD